MQVEAEAQTLQLTTEAQLAHEVDPKNVSAQAEQVVAVAQVLQPGTEPVQLVHEEALTKK